MPYTNKRKALSEKQAFEKIQSYCAYQERSKKDVLEKLYEFGLTKDVTEAIINKLISENFLNESRFGQSFARGKFRMKKWGKNKIVQELMRKGLSEKEISNSLKEIDEESYLHSLESLLTKKNELLKDEDKYKKIQKLAAFAIRKGYEQELVWEKIKELFAEY
ncbi:MAG: regulatory protein RecX [Cytophagaceae bacterium]